MKIIREEETIRLALRRGPAYETTCRGSRLRPRLRAAFGLAVALVALLSGSSTRAQWRVDGIPALTGSAAPVLGYEAVGDGQGGALVIAYTYPPGVFVQHLDSSGAALLPGDGAQLSTSSLQELAALSDGAGGAFVAWTAYTGQPPGALRSLFVQRVSASGALQWGQAGVEIITTAAIGGLALAADGTGGIIVAWSDDRDSTDAVYAQRLSSAGVPQWASGGVAVCSGSAMQTGAKVASDGSGGAFIAWGDFRGADADIYVQRLNGAGAAQWAPAGVRVFAKEQRDQYPSAVLPSGTGAIVVWQSDHFLWGSDPASFPEQIYAQRLSAQGTMLWDTTAVRLGNNSTTNITHINPTVVPDGTGGTVVSWMNHDPASDTDNIYTPYALRVDSTGAFLWAVTGVALAPGAFAGLQWPRSCSDGQGGAIVTWLDRRAGTGDHVYAQRMTAAGTRAWSVGGVPICASSHAQDSPIPTPDGSGGAVICWRDGRYTSPNYDVYARRLPAVGLRIVSLNWGAGGHIEVLDPAPATQESLAVSVYEEATIQVRPDFGDYYVNSVSVDGSSVGVVPNVTFAHPTSNHTVYAGFSNSTWFDPAVVTPTRAYTTLAFPLTFADDSVRSVLGELGPYDDTVWRMARWDPVAGAYQYNGHGLSTLQAGAGYWLITAAGAQVQADGTPLTADTVGVDLLGNATSGWNQIANPFRFPVADTALRVLGPAGLVAFRDDVGNTATDHTLWEWKGGTIYGTVHTLQPRKAYWVRKAVAQPVHLVFPNWSSTYPDAAPAALPAGASWAVALTARQGEAESQRVQVGAWSRAAERAALRLEAPPSSPAGGLSLRVGDAAEPQASRVAQFDGGDGPWSWTLELSGADAPGEVQLAVEGEALPTGLRLWLSDDAQGWSQELQPGAALTLAATATPRRLTLRAALDGGVPATAGSAEAKLAAYPNPFHERVGLVLRLPRAAVVELSICDVQGRKARSWAPVSLAPGEHVQVWDGRDQSGRAVPPGVYSVRLAIDGSSETHRVVRLR